VKTGTKVILWTSVIIVALWLFSPIVYTVGVWCINALITAIGLILLLIAVGAFCVYWYFLRPIRKSYKDRRVDANQPKTNA
jgi:type VI protein secretion system component VasK